MADRHEITEEMLNEIRCFLAEDCGNATQLAKACGVSRSAISRIRSGQTKTVRGDCWSALNRHFGFTVSDSPKNNGDFVERNAVLRALISAGLSAVDLQKALNAVMEL